MNKTKHSLFNDISLIVLIAANLFSIIGILLWDWNAAALLLVYWFESAIIGFFNILKMGFVEIRRFSGRKSFARIPFFIVHYGIFMFAHLMVILWFVLASQSIRGIIQEISSLGIFVMVLFASHGFSFFTNFIIGKEYLRTNAKELFFTPYKRVIVMQVSLILGMFLGFAFMSWHMGISRTPGPAGLVIGPALLLVLIKILTDSWAHMQQHKTLRRQ